MTTPIETYDGILVKREDLCFDAPAPPFSKLRGLMVHLKKQKQLGITTIGYVETSISMAGWGVAWACELLGLHAVIFNPVYKNETCKTLLSHRKQWKKFNAQIIDLTAGRTKVNWYIARKILIKDYPNSILLPLGLSLSETVEETSKVVIETFSDINVNSLVICVGSGTISSGVWRGLDKIKWKGTIHGVMCTTGNKNAKLKRIEHKSGVSNSGMFKSPTEFHIIDPGWEYTEEATVSLPPFPCNRFYDRKAWQWLIENRSEVKEPILFWNIGH